MMCLVAAFRWRAPSRALQQADAAFPSWFLHITCDRCGKASMFNGAHTKGARAGCHWRTPGPHAR